MISGQTHRTPSGGLIDRSKRLSFFFDGKSYQGYDGDTLASALLANGERLVGRSFKYHRPRGIMSTGASEPNALVELRESGRREPNQRATEVELFDGLVARSQNRWPSLKYDFLSVNQFFSPMLVAGFYYKTFKWPDAFWEPVYERFIRKAAGLGRAAEVADPDTYEKVHAHCDVLVIGGGPAGLMAAREAAEAGADVVVAESDSRFGGSLNNETIVIGNSPSNVWVDGMVEALEAMPNVRMLPRATVFGRYDGGTYTLTERVGDHLVAPEPFHPRQRLWRIYTKRAILAAGATERPIVFGGNDKPGVMLAHAARAYANRFAVRAGDTAVIFGNNDDIYRTATDLEAVGTEIAAIIDARDNPDVAKSYKQFRVLTGHEVVRAHGSHTVTGAEIRRVGDEVAFETLPCDLIAVAGGWTANVQIATHLGAKADFDDATLTFRLADTQGELSLCGAADANWDTAGCLADGQTAGRAAADAIGKATSEAQHLPRVDEGPLGSATAHFRVEYPEGKAFVDFQHDVTDKDLKLAIAEGYDTAEHAKRYTTMGMATDQGRTASVTGAAILADAMGVPIADFGTTKARPPFTATTIGALAGPNVGKHFLPTRHTPLRAWNEANGAQLVEAGLWYRASYYPKAGEDWLAAAKREAAAVRRSVGICDVTTLGKIDIQGPDAATFLNRLYVNNWLKLPIGKARYGLMLREDGSALDDGTTSRLGENHFLMTTTTAAAAVVMSHMEYCHEVLWPDLDVHYSSVTEQWGQIAVAGPNSRAVLEKLVTDRDLSNDAFPFMAVGDVTLSGVKLGDAHVQGRLFRISFSGEMAYELAVPADTMTAVWEALMAAGEAHGVVAYGLEALNILRVEKGHVTHSELDGRITGRDAGLGRMENRKKDFIGRSMSERPAHLEPNRQSLVGLKPVDAEQRLMAGSHLLAEGASERIENDQGWVSSVAFSPAVGSWIGLALIEGGPRREGERIRAVDFMNGSDVVCEIVSPVFVDPKGERLHG